MNALIPAIQRTAQATKGKRISLSRDLSAVVFAMFFVMDYVGIELPRISKEIDVIENTVTNTVTVERFFALVNGQVVEIDEQGNKL